MYEVGMGKTLTACHTAYNVIKNTKEFKEIEKLFLFYLQY